MLLSSLVVYEAMEEPSTKNSGLESRHGEVDVVTRSVEGDLPFQRGGSLFEIDDVSSGQGHTQLSRLVWRRAFDLFFLAHSDELFKDLGEEGDLLPSTQLLQHRLQEQLLVIRRIYEDGLIEDVAVVLLPRHRGFLDVTHDVDDRWR